MTVDLQLLNGALSQVEPLNQMQDLVAEARMASGRLSALMQSRLTEINSIVSGFQLLTQDVDSGEEVSFNSGIAMLVSDPDSLTITRDTPPTQADLEAITEVSMAGGFLDLAVTANTPEAIGRTLGRITNLPLTQLQTSISSLSLDNFGSLGDALRDLQRGLDAVNNLQLQLTQFQARISSILENGLNGVLSNFIEGFAPEIAPVLNTIANVGRLTENLRIQLNAHIQVGNIIEAAELLRPLSSLSLDAIEQLLGNIEVNISGILGVERSEVTRPENTVEVRERIESGPEDPDVEEVGPAEEIHAYFAGLQREVTEIVVGSTNTPIDYNPQPSEITGGWHFLIDRNGQIRQVSPLEQTGDYSETHAEYSVGVIFAGGAAGTVREISEGLYGRQPFNSVSNYTQAQWLAFSRLVQMFYTFYPYAQFFSLSDIDRNNESPGFSAAEYVRARFGIINVVNPESGSASLAELSDLMTSSVDGTPESRGAHGSEIEIPAGTPS